MRVWVITETNSSNLGRTVKCDKTLVQMDRGKTKRNDKNGQISTAKQCTKLPAKRDTD
jgi:hypothetical protein